jgi:type IV pilus assembly protein PilB
MDQDIPQFFRGIGCRRCRNTGYSGRIAIHELLVLNDDMRDLITANPTLGAIRQLAIEQGMKTLHVDGCRKVREGITSIEEILNATGEIREGAIGRSQTTSVGP